MSAGQNFQSLALYDTVANFIPGAIWLLYFVVAFYPWFLVVLSVPSSLSYTLFVVGVILAYLLGRITQAFGRILFGNPYTFGKIVQEAKPGTDNTDGQNQQGENSADGDDQTEESSVKGRLEQQFWYLCKERFDDPRRGKNRLNLDNEFDEYGALFKAVLSRLDGSPYSRALRFQALFSFHRSMMVVTVFIAALSVLTLLITLFVGFATGHPLFLSIHVISLALSATTFWLFRWRYKKFDKTFVRYAIVDFINAEQDVRQRTKQTAYNAEESKSSTDVSPPTER